VRNHSRRDRSSSPKDEFQTPEANINVVVRIRPILQKELQNSQISIVSTNNENQIFISDPRGQDPMNGQD